jgi:hypothetical protein
VLDVVVQFFQELIAVNRMMNANIPAKIRQALLIFFFSCCSAIVIDYDINSLQYT